MDHSGPTGTELVYMIITVQFSPYSIGFVFFYSTVVCLFLLRNILILGSGPNPEKFISDPQLWMKLLARAHEKFVIIYQESL